MVWNFIWLFVLICECTLVPYTVCQDTKKILTYTIHVEEAIDFLWLVHMYFTLTTAFY